MNHNYYSNDDLMKGIQKIARQLVVDKWEPDYVAGILRGGIIPAVYLSHWFDVPMLAIEWSTRDGLVGKSFNKELMDKLYIGDNILIVDDICDSGLTLEQVVNGIEKKYKKDAPDDTPLNLKSACLHFNIGQDLFEPDYYHVEINKDEDSRWIVYPWEDV